MGKYRLMIPMLLGVGLVALPALLPEAHAAALEMQTTAPGTSRVWFLRPAGSADGNVWGASPMIYANGTPVAAIPPGAGFYRDFTAGTYSFTVEPYGLPTGNADTVQLARGRRPTSKSSGHRPGRKVIQAAAGAVNPTASSS
jgi:hypothetical protein